MTKSKRAAKNTTADTKGVHVVTCCTSTCAVPPVIRTADLPSGITMQEALDHWVGLYNQAMESGKGVTVGELYRGIGFSVVTKIRAMLGNDNIHVASGATGMTKFDTKVVPYDFTSNKSHAGNIYEHVTAEPFVLQLWWRMINKGMGRNGGPVQQLLDDPDVDIVVVAVNRFFIRLLAEDMMSAQAENLSKLRIAWTSKNFGPIPHMLRGQTIQISKDAIESTIGNRNNLNHRAALKLVELMENGTLKIGVSASEHRAALEGTNLLLDIGAEPAKGPPIEDILHDMPELLDCDTPEEAYHFAKQAYEAFGGWAKFRGEWLHQKRGGEQVKANVDDEALASFQALGLEASLMSSAGASTTDVEQVLGYMANFVELVRRAQPGSVFTGKMAHAWLQDYLKRKGLSTLAVAYGKQWSVSKLLDSNQKALNIERIKIPGVGQQAFRAK